MRGHSVNAAELDAAGLRYDRRYLVVDASDRFVTQRGLPAMATLTPHVDVPPSQCLEEIDSKPAVRSGPVTLTRPALVLSVNAHASNGFCDAPPLRVPLVTRKDVMEGKGAAGTCLRDVTVWSSTVEQAVDQGDFAAVWLSTVLRQEGLRLVHFDEGDSDGDPGCVREISDSHAPERGSGFSAQVSFADGFPCALVVKAYLYF